ncbi:flagellar hook capping FlgD N-terminal domain-containing protein [Nocardioides sp. GCM10027113]|uniref:flagellar hook capping FlgD N-terminal domain-containing protein n=1 Tax=unclassified Nocardioides TaxID=2615069 RepID=UPI0036182713
MSIQATEAVGGGSFVPGMPGTPGSSAAEDKQMFLELLVAQLRYQDPLNPTDSGEFLAQSAQFTALEKMQEVAEATTAMLGVQMAFGASSLVGRHVSWTGEDGQPLSGTVAGVTFGASGPVLDVDGTDVPLASVVSVTASPSASPSPGTQSTGSAPTTPAP